MPKPIVVFALGEVDKQQQQYQNQIAKTVMSLLGLEYPSKQKVGEALEQVIR